MNKRIILLLLGIFVIMTILYFQMHRETSYIEKRTGMTQEEFNDFQYEQGIELLQTGKSDNGKTLAIPYNSSREQIKEILEGK